MSDVAIRVEGLGKRYRIGRRTAPYRSLRESLTNAAMAPWRRLRHGFHRTDGASGDDTIWALKDVSLEVRRGEVVGVIGRNGAGKSTLLKVLSRITEPTEGRVELNGRVGSLLEVGTGFHLELTGRENIFLNGAILGMRRAEILRKFDEIVAFAEIDKFLDTPVKHYSSGMYVRLAFAVAAHLEPEILLVDEVLAVGDAAFQKKCLGKMELVAAEGRTVLFVSHSMASVARLCPRTLLLQTGTVCVDGPSKHALARYLSDGAHSPASRVWTDVSSAPGGPVVRIVAVRVRDAAGQSVSVVDIRNEFGIDVDFVNLQEGARLVPSVHVHNDMGLNVFTSIDVSLPSWYNKPHPAGSFRATCWIPGNLLAEGRFTVRAAVSTHSPDVVHADVPEAVSFFVSDNMAGGEARGSFARDFPGVVRPLLRWTMDHPADGSAPAERERP